MATPILKPVWMKAKKNVGLKAFFPELNQNLSNYEKARIWVKRHNNNYFVGWKEEQLLSVDPSVRPLTVITPALYKRHMNRSEFGRITKLKYCMESDADWAKEFRQRLETDLTDGGFKSLGEAKLCASDLWRRYSELYDAQRARGISPKGVSPSLSSARSLKPTRSPKAKHSLRRLSPGVAKREAQYTQLTVEGRGNHGSFDDATCLPGGVSVKQEPSESPLDHQCIFPKLDEIDVPLKEKVNILLERARNDFFLNWSESQLRTASVFARPYAPVSQAMYERYQFSDDGQTASTIATVCNIKEPWVDRFRQRLDLPVEAGGWHSFSELKEEASRLLTTFLEDNDGTQFKVGSATGTVDSDVGTDGQSPEDLSETTPESMTLDFSDLQEAEMQLESSLPDIGSADQSCSSSNYSLSLSVQRDATHLTSPTGELRPVVTATRSRKRPKFLTPPLGSASTPQTKPKEERLPQSVSKRPSLDFTAHSAAKAGRSDNRSKPQALGQKNTLTSVSAGAPPNLWKYRQEVINQCQEDPLLSWHDRLRPHLPTIRRHLGETYTLPSTVAECVTDLVLVTLQQCTS